MESLSCTACLPDKQIEDKSLPSGFAKNFLETKNNECFHGFEVRQVQEPTINMFELGEQLGSGRIGKVYSATCKKNMCDLAIKIIDISKIKNREKEVALELNALSFLKKKPHQNVIKFFGHLAQGNYRYFILERADMTLKDYIKKHNGYLATRKFNEIAFQLLEGLNYFYSKRIARYDTTITNVVFSQHDNKLKYIDFGNTFLNAVSDNFLTRTLDSIRGILMEALITVKEDWENLPNDQRQKHQANFQELKEFIDNYFINITHAPKEVIANRESFSPREKLTLP